MSHICSTLWEEALTRIYTPTPMLYEDNGQEYEEFGKFLPIEDDPTSEILRGYYLVEHCLHIVLPVYSRRLMGSPVPKSLEDLMSTPVERSVSAYGDVLGLLDTITHDLGYTHGLSVLANRNGQHRYNYQRIDFNDLLVVVLDTAEVVKLQIKNVQDYDKVTSEKLAEAAYKTLRAVGLDLEGFKRLIGTLATINQENPWTIWRQLEKLATTFNLAE